VLVLNWRDRWSPEAGGSELYVQQVARLLHGPGGVRITWFTALYPGAAREEVVDGIRYVRRGGHVTVYLWAAVLMLLGRFGRVDAALEVQNWMPFLARLFTRARVVVLVHHVHREQWYVVGPLLSRVGWFMESKVAVRVNQGLRYVAVSDRTRQELIGLGVEAADIDIAHNGTPPAPDHVEIGPAANDPTLVVLSRLVPHKQIDHAIRMMPRLIERHPGATLRIMGSGWWGDHLVALRDELDLVGRVQFLGHVDEGTKYTELAQAWLHLMPSLKEGWGLSIIEAARVGVPSIAYRSAGGVTESILDGVTGVLVDDQDDLAAKVAQLLSEPGALAALGEKARIRSTQYTWEAAAARIRSALLDGRRQILS
jgi:glycosyltransferase involved in cell wall biosynthesis